MRLFKRNNGEKITLETRYEANESVDKETRYKQIIEILKANPKGLTAKEIALKMYAKGYSYSAERNISAPRLTELSYKGIVEPVGKTICKYSKKWVSVYRLRNGKN